MMFLPYCCAPLCDFFLHILRLLSCKIDRKGCHRCLVMYEKHRNVLQYKESECEGDNMYMDQSNPAAMPMREQPQRSILNSDHRGAAHPNTNGNGNHGHARVSSSDPYSMRSHDDATNDCKHYSQTTNQKENHHEQKIQQTNYDIFVFSICIHILSTYKQKPYIFFRNQRISL